MNWRRGFFVKFMKKLLLSVATVLLLSACGSQAQVARLYNLFNLTDGTTNDPTVFLPAASTNQVGLLSGTVTNQVGSPTSTTTITSSNIVINCHEFDKGGLSFQFVGSTGATNGLFGVQIYATANKGLVWDANPRWNFTTTNAAPNGAATYSTNVSLDLSGMDRIGFVFLNGCANGYLTNVVATVRLKASKVMIVPASD